MDEEVLVMILRIWFLANPVFTNESQLAEGTLSFLVMISSTSPFCI